MPEITAYNISAWTQGYEQGFEIPSKGHTEQHENKLCTVSCIIYLQSIWVGFAQINIIFELMLQTDSFKSCFYIGWLGLL